MPTLLKAARIALAFLWIFTGLTSLFFLPELGYEILANADIKGESANFLVYGGSLIDIGLGLWVISPWKLKNCCIAQVTTIIIYTLLLTMIDASFWLHPFGPLTKNLPVLVLIFIVLINDEPAKI